MPTWKKYKLEEVTTKIGSGATPRGGENSYKKVGISLIRSQNVLDFTFSKNGLAYIDEEQASRLNNVSVEKDDVLLNITGDSVARVCQVPDRVLPARVNQHVAIIRPNKNDLYPKFLKYFLLNPVYKDYLLMLAGSGGTRKALTKEMVENLEITLPPLPIQKRIAEILGALDDKIELNLQMNKTLEEMAMALYKHWFVDFGPFREGEFTDSELGPIPKGWEVKEIGNITQLKYGKALRAKDRVTGSFPVYGSSGIVGSNESYLIEGPSIIIGRKGNVGSTYWENNPSYPIDTVFFINSLPLSLLRFIFFTFKNLDFSNRNSDSAVPGLNRNIAQSEKIVFPQNKILINFENIVISYYNQIFHNEIENESLIQTRDYLLPKLISGEIPLN